MSITVRAAAKINLHLGVGRAREDGFHPLDTVYQAIGIHDDVTLTAAEGLSLDTLVADHIDPAGVPAGADNIVLRAARLLAERAGRRATGAFEVRKDIPVAGGMAGGSADAAAALVACDRLWDLHTPDEVLLALAAELGSDIPFSLVGGTARGVGRGEVVTPVAGPGLVVVGRRAVRRGPVDAGGLPPLRHPAAGRPGGARRPPSRCSPRSRRASRCGWPAPCTTTSRSLRSTCVPSSAT